MLKLYKTAEIAEKMVYYVDCNVNSGIQYIRDEIHFIAKKNIIRNNFWLLMDICPNTIIIFLNSYI